MVGVAIGVAHLVLILAVLVAIRRRRAFADRYVNRLQRLRTRLAGGRPGRHLRSVE
ncbi:hypothetical protein [Micromonospora thermarum]|uniref:Uncharacterized protein n=1 Tax=Micromonospora thermarum TaxID=2720024 RepID=A0ABX0Z743_9ACTN|nr:hypothetical protein [Micromonospora thermarum]NJP33671.1 hypothetical protein [Micromonospora thermarum]